MALVNQRLAAQSGGVFYLRIEDTDQKREVEGAVSELIRGLAYFGIEFDEGVGLTECCGCGLSGSVVVEGCGGGFECGQNGNGLECGSNGGVVVERGAYGPYFQSARREIYHGFAQRLLDEGKAYHCFLTEDEIADIRKKQEAAKELPGIYGAYAKWRGADADLVAEKIQSCDPYVIRFNADHEGAACEGESIVVADGIRGELTMPRNNLDTVILKKDGLPTYHFAHVVDDHLMETTHVVRGEEWLSSLPIHISLFRALGFEPPVYCHTALLMKLDGGIKRKLSKRTDPESALSYYIADGYHPIAVREYLLTVINSNYEEWRLSNPDVDSNVFEVTTEKMGSAGMLFDLDKLQNISRDVLARIPAGELAGFVLDWAEREKPEAFATLLEGRDVLEAALDIGRAGEKPRKDLVYAAQMFDFVSYFFDAYFRMDDPLPEGMSESEAGALLTGYLESYDHADDRDRWFEKVRELAFAHGYAPKPKDYKNNPEMYKGHVGDVSTVIRRALAGRCVAPDIYEIQQILGEERVRGRLGVASLI